MKLYKVTDANFQTRGYTQWGEGVTNKARDLKDGERRMMCTDTVIHAYTDPLLASMMIPCHVDFEDRILWEAKGSVVVGDPAKVGCTSLTTVRQIPMPEISTNARVRFAILCVMKIESRKEFTSLADSWLSGKDRGLDQVEKIRSFYQFLCPHSLCNAMIKAHEGNAYAAGVSAAISVDCAVSQALDLDLIGLLKQAIADEEALAKRLVT